MLITGRYELLLGPPFVGLEGVAYELGVMREALPDPFCRLGVAEPPVNSLSLSISVFCNRAKGEGVGCKLTIHPNLPDHVYPS